MNEWDVVGVIVTLVGLLAALLKPLLSLTRSITELTTVVRDLKADVVAERAHTKESRKRLWDHNAEQDKQLDDHETRIGRLEGKNDTKTH